MWKPVKSHARKRVTSKDVATRAGVSRTTVSFVLNDVRHAKISDETRQRVLQAADALGYVPHAVARALASGKTGTLGLLVRPFGIVPYDAFLHQLIHGLMEECIEHGYRLLIETATPSPSPESYVQMVRARQIDGLVVLGLYEEDPGLSALIDSGYPVVLLAHSRLRDCRLVLFDEEDALVRSTSHLIALGHRRIGFIHFAPLRPLAEDARLRGYLRALEAAELPCLPDLVCNGEFSAASGYEAMRNLLAKGAPPTALVTGNDTIAIGAMAAIREAGFRVPEDIAVAGFDDIPIARYATPPLTTIRLPIHAISRACGELAIAAIQGDPEGERTRSFDSRLIVRHSCGAIPGSDPFPE